MVTGSGASIFPRSPALPELFLVRIGVTAASPELFLPLAGNESTGVSLSKFSGQSHRLPRCSPHVYLLDFVCVLCSLLKEEVHFVLRWCSVCVLCSLLKKKCRLLPWLSHRRQ